MASAPVATSYTDSSDLLGGVSYRYRVSAINAQGAGAGATGDAMTDPVEPGAPASAVATLNRGSTPLSVTVSWEAPADDGGSAITGYMLLRSVYPVPADQGDTTIADDIPADARSYEDSSAGLSEDQVYVYRILAVNAVGVSAAAQAITRSLTETVTNRLHDSALPVVSEIVFSQANAGLVNRMLEAPAHLRESRLAGSDTGDDDVRLQSLVARLGQGVQRGTSRDLWRALDGASFSMALGGDGRSAAPISGFDEGWEDNDWGTGSPDPQPEQTVGTNSGPTFWGSAMFLDLGGDSGTGQDNLNWSGSTLTAQLGLDLLLGQRALVGISVGHTTAEFDYLLGTSGSSNRGNYEYTNLAVHPYLAFYATPRMTLWTTLGFGTGEINIQQLSEQASTDTTSVSAGAGVNLDFWRQPVILAGGATQVSVKLSSSLLATTVEEAEYISERDISSQRHRLLLELRHQRSLYEGGSLTPSVEFGLTQLSHDAGSDAENAIDDGSSGLGYEAGIGLIFSDTGTGLNISGRAHTLTGYDHDEMGASLSVSFDSRIAGRGAYLQLSPSWGARSASAQAAYETGMASAGSGQRLAGSAAQQGGRLNAEVGYGFRRPLKLNLPGSYGGVLTPYGGVELTANGGRRMQIGNRLQLGNKLQLDVEAAHGDSRKGPDTGYAVEVRARFRL